VMRSMIPAPIWVKWPNDVLAGPRPGKKLAGVLVEAQIRGADVHSLVVGVGVNVHARSFPEEIAARATSLAMLGAEGLDRSAIAAELIQAIDDVSARYELNRLASFMDDLKRYDALRGLEVEVGGVRGVAGGIDEEGRLLVGGIPVVSGEVSILSC
jgi:BirA family biotin operon repressor/biotin-[acetyl-CoA-carboxylase] ligase